MVTSTAPRFVTDRVLRLRYWLYGALSLSWAVIAGGRGDWNRFVVAGHRMFGADGLHVYERNVDIQTGPISLMLARLLSTTPRNGFVACVLLSGLAGAASLRIIEWQALSREPASRRRIETGCLIGGVPLAFTWSKLGGYGHLDDALVLLTGVAATVLALRGRTWAVAVLVGVAAATKPWAIVFVPLTMIDLLPALAGHARGLWLRSLAAPGLAIGITAMFWSPFIIAAPGTRDAIRPTVKVADDSILRMIGFADSTVPAGIRTFQVLLAIALGVCAVAARRSVSVMMVAIAVRIATDPGTWSYYTPGLVVSALLVDVLGMRRILPIASLTVLFFLAPSWLVPSSDLLAVLRLAGCLLAALFGLLSERVPSSDPMHPKSDPTAID